MGIADSLQTGSSIISDRCTENNMAKSKKVRKALELRKQLLSAQDNCDRLAKKYSEFVGSLSTNEQEEFSRARLARETKEQEITYE